MRYTEIDRRLLTALACILACACTSWARIIYVDADAPGGNNGSNWSDAFLYLQDALMTASPPDEIRVARGTCKPDQFVLSMRRNLGRAETFNLISGTTLKGGYAGFGEPDPNARNVELYETILSGDRNGDDINVQDPCDLPNEPTRADNCYHVLSATTGQAPAVLDGFTITAGNANGEFDPFLDQSSGGGMLIRWPFDPTGQMGEEGPVLIDCTFINNSARGGGGVYIDEPAKAALTNCTFTDNFANWGAGVGNGGYPTLLNCTFTGNSASWRGGAMANGETRAVLENCTFIENRAQYGGAMYNGESRTTLTNCTLIGNSAERGGAILNRDSSLIMTNCLASENSCTEEGGLAYLGSDDSATLTNCILTANTAAKGGALHIGYDSYAELTNCTFTGNRATNNGGALYIDDADDAIVTNCILWDNIPQEFYPEDPGSRTVIARCNIQGITPGNGNISADPCFADPGRWDMAYNWINGDYHLKSQAGRWDTSSASWIQDDVTSPCIDAGDPMSPIGPEPFPNGGLINMGAHGGTPEASKSYFNAPTCQTIIAGDINGDCTVDFTDFRLMALHWLEQH